MTRSIFNLIVVSLACLFSSAVTAAEKSGAYQLRQGDNLMISVWREDALQKEVRILPDGSITFPLVGRVEVGGLSSPEVEQRIAEKLKEYIPEPIVTVVITGIDGNRAYVLGKVTRPGPMIMTVPMTVLQALSVAGGLDKFADEGAIKVIRNLSGNQEILPVNYKDLISGRNLKTNVLLQAGDTILVP